PRSSRRSTHCRGHCLFCLRLSCPIHADRSSRLFRHGRRPRLLSHRRLGPSPHTRPGDRHRAAGLWAVVIALTGTYSQVVNYVVAMDSIFFGLTGVCLVMLRRRDAPSLPSAIDYRVPGHPWTTLLFIAAEWLVVISTFVRDPRRSSIGLAIALAGLPVYFFWRAKNREATTA